MKILKNNLAAFLANLHAESGGFKYTEESFRYKSPARVRQMFSKCREMSDAELTALMKDQRALANFVYNGRMGNREGSDDGWNFRGSGYIQLTGRDNFKAFAEEVPALNLKGYPEMLANKVRTDPYFSAKAAQWYYEKYLAKSSSIKDMIFRINPGLKNNGQEILKRLNLAERYHAAITRKPSYDDSYYLDNLLNYIGDYKL
jgi:putative chitinase